MATANIYNNALLEMVKGSLNFQTTTTPTFKVMLIAASPAYTFSKTHETVAQVKTAGATEISGTGYTAGGAFIPSVTVPAVSANAVSVEFADVVWASSTLSARAAIVYKPGATDADSKVIAYVDFGTTVSSNNSALTVDFQTPLKLQN